MYRHQPALFLIGLSSLALAAQREDASGAVAPQQVLTTQKLPLLFFENQGQLDSRVEYAGARGGLASFFTADGFTVRLDERAPAVDGEAAARGATLKYTFLGSNPDADLRGEEPNKALFNFYKGVDPMAWRAAVPSFGSVRYADLYAGIDLVVRDAQGVLEYDLVLAPGASLDQVRIRCEGADSLSIGPDGDLLAATRFGTLAQRFPRTWQLDASGERQAVDSSFVLFEDGVYGFAAPDRDPSRGAVIDPGLTYSSYLGGTNSEHGCGVEVDELCGLYVTGDTLSLDFPTKPGNFDVTHNGDFDVFVSRIDPTGGHLIYSTYIGGSNGDFGHGITVGHGGAGPGHTGEAGVAYISGGTKSADYPTTGGAFDQSANGQGDAFITTLNPTGTALVFSSLIGGLSEEGSLGGQALDIDSTGNVYLVGFSGSGNFPTTGGANDTTFNGVVDVFASKFLPDGTALVYSTFVGGSTTDIANAVDVDELGNAYVVGFAESNDYPTTPGAFATTPNGVSNGIVTKLDPTGSTLVYSTFTGGSSEVVRGIGVENQEAFVGGYTLSSIFPATAGAFDTTPGGNGDGFVMRLNTTGTSALYASYLGGIEVDVINDVDTDELGHAYFGGWTESLDFPTTAEAFDSSFNGGRDSFCSRASIDGSQLDYSSYLGGSSNDVGFALNVHDVGAFYIVGSTFSSDFPTTAGAVDTTYNGLEDVFVVLMPAGPTTCTDGAAAVAYGAGEVDSAGNTPTLSAPNAPAVPSLGFSINLTNAQPNVSVTLLIGLAPTSAPFDGGTLLVNPVAFMNAGVTDAGGNLTLSTPIAANPNFCGDMLFVQAALNDRGSASAYQITLTNALQLTFGN